MWQSIPQHLIIIAHTRIHTHLCLKTWTNMVFCTLCNVNVIILLSSTSHNHREIAHSKCVAVKLMIQRGKREGTRSRPVWREGWWEEVGGTRQTKGSGLCVVCEDLCPSVRGKCVSVVQCVSAVELGFTLLTSHTFPPVSKGKYIHAQKCTVIQHASGCPDCTHCMYCPHTHSAVCMWIVVVSVFALCFHIFGTSFTETEYVYLQKVSTHTQILYLGAIFAVLVSIMCYLILIMYYISRGKYCTSYCTTFTLCFCYSDTWG